MIYLRQRNFLHFLHTIPAQRWVTVGILVVLVIGINLVNPLFLTWNNINGIFQQISAMGIIALGAMVVLISGGIDFTTGTGLAMTGVLAGVLYINASENILVLILGSMSGGIILGFINGFFIAKCKLKPFVATLAVMAFAQGLTLLISEGKLAFLNHPATFVIGGGSIFGILSVSFLIFLGVAMLTWFLLNKTKIGTYVYAIGGNEDSAHYMFMLGYVQV